MLGLGALLWGICLVVVQGQKQCTSSLRGKTSPRAIPGFTFDVIATDLTNARGIVFDSLGRLLVVKSGTGIVALSLSNETCASVVDSKLLIQDTSLNHGIQFSPDGNKLYVSNSNNLSSWDYN